MIAKRLMTFAVVILSAVAYAQDGQEGVFYDSVTGDYTVRYVAPADDEGPSTVEEGTYFTHTKVDPILTSSVDMSGGQIRYQFAITSATTSRQPVISLGAPCEGYVSIEQWESPTGWRAMSNLRNSVPQARDVRWLYKDLKESPAVPPRKGLAPGAKQTGFSLTASSLPGVGTACLQGNGQVNTYSTQYLDPESPVGASIHQALDELRKNDHVLRFAAIPSFRLPDPYSPVPVLESLRSHVAGWPAQQLMDQALWITVDGLLKSAIDGLKKTDTKGPAASLTQIRVDLREKYPDLDVGTTLDDPKASDLPKAPDALKAYLTAHDLRLAARVLDFDVAFVTMKLDPAGLLQADAPYQGTMYTPLLDTDGSFLVTWTQPVSSVQTRCTTDVTGCKEVLVGYALETADNKDFQGARTVYDGPNTRFQATAYGPGTYFFRVKAHMLRCKGPSGLSLESWTCSASEPGVEHVDTNYYAVGPNVTVVAIR